MPLILPTIPHILDRTRDTDVTMRKLVYSAILEYNATLDHDDHKDAQKVRTKEENELAAAGLDEDIKPDVNSLDNASGGKSSTGKRNDRWKTKHMGPTHPRALTIAQREHIVRNGLGDREPSVRTAAEALVGTWVDVVNVGLKLEEDLTAENEDIARGQTLLPKSTGNEAVEGCVAFLRLFDLESDVASDALLSVFASRPDIYDGLEFDGPFCLPLAAMYMIYVAIF